jgi:hypothetical protein
MRAEDRLDRGAPGGGAATQARRTVATFDLLELREAEAAVDRLSDRGFPVQWVDEAARLLAWPARHPAAGPLLRRPGRRGRRALGHRRRRRPGLPRRRGSTDPEEPPDQRLPGSPPRRPRRHPGCRFPPGHRPGQPAPVAPAPRGWPSGSYGPAGCPGPAAPPRATGTPSRRLPPGPTMPPEPSRLTPARGPGTAGAGPRSGSGPGRGPWPAPRGVVW